MHVHIIGDAEFEVNQVANMATILSDERGAAIGLARPCNSLTICARPRPPQGGPAFRWLLPGDESVRLDDSNGSRWRENASSIDAPPNMSRCAALIVARDGILWVMTSNLTLEVT